MENSSFLARKTVGQPNYLLIALAAAFFIAAAPYSAYQAVRSSANRTEDWLPERYDAAQDLAWFRENFLGEQFVLVSWDGCTLGNTEKLDLLAKKLTNDAPPTDARGAATPSKWFSRVITGPEVLDQLTRPPLNLSYDEAVERLEGVLIGRRPRDPAGAWLDDDQRVTCLVAHLSPAAMSANRWMRAAIDHIAAVAETECGIDAETIHMGGPPVDNVAIDVESQRMLVPIVALAGVVGVILCYWRLRNWKLTAMVFAVGAISAAMSLAMVYYCGVLEVLALGRAAPRWGALDAVLLAMPALVYVLALAGALHAVNCYREARRDGGVIGAAERCARMSWGPASVAAMIMAAALASLFASDILPIQRFGVFAAAGVLASLGVIFAVVPIWLHRFPLVDGPIQSAVRQGRLARWIRAAFEASIERRGGVLACWLVLMAAAGYGLTRLEASVRLTNLLDGRARLSRDYAWLEQNLGALAPLEIVVTMPPERLRAADERAEEDGQQYRLTMLERLKLVGELERRVARLPHVSGAISAATFAAPPAGSKSRPDRTADYATTKVLEQHRGQLLDSDFYQQERRPMYGHASGRELWRVSARLKTAGSGSDIDFGQAIQAVRDAVNPVLLAYQQRDCITQVLHEQGKELAGARVCILFRAPDQAPAPPPSSQEAQLALLLRRSGAAPRGVTYFNLGAFDRPGRENPAKDEEYRQRAIDALRKQDIVVLASASSDPTVKKLAASGAAIADVSDLPSVEESTTAAIVDDGGPRPIRAVITGAVPVLDQTQRLLPETMKASLFWAAALILGMMVAMFRSAVAGLAALVSCAFPLVVTFGALAWAGVAIDLGVMIAAGVALAVSVDGAVHYLAWRRRSAANGLSRRQAAVVAYDRAAEPIVQSAIIAGVGMLAFVLSSFTPLQQFGYSMLVMLPLSVAGNLLVLPALVATPLGEFFKVQHATNRKATSGAAPAAQPPAPRVNKPHAPVQPLPTQPAGAAVPVRAVISAGDRHEVAHGPHSALQAKLQELRRTIGRESTGSTEG